MLKIGEFSKLSMLTVKTLRYYEREGLLEPAAIDEWTGYRLYETAQLQDAARIRAYRQLGLTIAQTKQALGGCELQALLEAKARELEDERQDIDQRLSIISYLLKEEKMTYQVTEKEIPAHIVYYSEATLPNYSDIMEWIPRCGQECLALNPGLKCADPPYEYCEFLNAEYQEHDVRIRHNEAVIAFGAESDLIKFREVPAAKVLSIFHKGPYDMIGNAYSYLWKYAAENGYECAGLTRESYIDGIWNKEDPADWLTELQLPIK